MKPVSPPVLTISSTHDLELALRCVDRVWLMPKENGNGKNKIVSGAPEDLVLNGAFESVFAAEGVEFDRQGGHFRLHEASNGEAIVIGDGVVASWTARALERLGYRITSAPSAEATAEVFQENGQASWVCTQRGVVARYRSLEELANSIRRERSAAAQ